MGWKKQAPIGREEALGGKLALLARDTKPSPLPRKRKIDALLRRSTGKCIHSAAQFFARVHSLACLLLPEFLRHLLFFCGAPAAIKGKQGKINNGCRWKSQGEITERAPRGQRGTLLERDLAETKQLLFVFMPVNGLHWRAERERSRCEKLCPSDAKRRGFPPGNSAKHLPRCSEHHHGPRVKYWPYTSEPLQTAQKK